MRINKILLGILWIVISMSGAAFTKADKRVIYYYQYNAIACAAIDLPLIVCVPGGTGCVVTIPNVGFRQIYLDPPAPGTTECRIPLRAQ